MSRLCVEPYGLQTTPLETGGKPIEPPEIPPPTPETRRSLRQRTLREHVRGARGRTSVCRERAKAKDVQIGRKPKLTHHQRREAVSRRDAGETLVDIARQL